MTEPVECEDCKVTKRQSYLVHDLGPVIASFESILKLVGEGRLDLEKGSHRKLLENSKASLEFAKMLIENILEFTCAGQQQDGGRRTEVRWEDFIAESLAIPQILARENEIGIAAKVVNGDLKSTIDRSVVRRIIQNLVVNAIKYCPMGSQVQVTVGSVDAQCIEVSVTDNGPGLPDDARSKIFDEYFQFGLRASRGFRGIGVGLTFAREAAILHGGSLTVEAHVPHGLCFRLRLPV